MFIYIEGMDLSGKTSLSKNLAQYLGDSWVIQSGSLLHSNPIRTLTDDLGRKGELDDDIAGYLYSVAAMVDVRYFRVSDKSHLIQDSMTIMRSLAYHSVLGVKGVTDLLIESIHKVPTPDYTFFLKADIPSRIVRLKRRAIELPGKITPNDSMILSDPDRFLDMEKTLHRYLVEYFDPIVIDTTSLTEPEVCISAIKYITQQ